MKKIPLPTTKRWLTGAAAGLAAFTGGERVAGAPWVELPRPAQARTAALDRFAGSYENILGTSLDLVVEAPRATDAVACETAVLAEIERLRKMFSTYDPRSEIRRAMAGGEGQIVSAELADLLSLYRTWSVRTAGLIDLHLGGAVGAWREAERSGRVPDRATLATAVTRSPATWNVDAMGKAFVIERAVAVARRFAPGGLLNLGGDLRAWGDAAWQIGVADPRDPADNAPPLARFTLREAAVATSGDYARFYTVGGKRFSHLLDPRTQWPAEHGLSATVVARDAVTANALSTAACIGGVAAGTQLALAHGAEAYLLANRTGVVAQSGGFALVPERALTPLADGEAKSASDRAAPTLSDEQRWPAGFFVAVRVALKKHEGLGAKRPYVAVWIEDAQGRMVRTVTLWGDRQRYLRELSEWWFKMKGDEQDPLTMTRGTRAPGVYTVSWIGTDEAGRRVPMGDYFVGVEISREHGHHVSERVKIACGKETASLVIDETVESDPITVTYGPAPKP